MKQTDYLIIGAGIAGLSAAYSLSELGSVTVILKGKLKKNNDYWVQGGIAAVMNKEDSFESHINDTLKTGAGHCNEHAVRYLVEHAPKAIRFLESIGLKFKKEHSLESGHSYKRVLHTSDSTGQDVLNKLIKVCKKKKNIKFLEETDVIKLITNNDYCTGAYIKNIKKTEIDTIISNNVILATGGAGRLFSKTTNVLASTGDGLALALKAGLELKDLEFIQFHPTALAEPDNSRYFLLPESLRGAGAKIIDQNGDSFLQNFDKRAELAPRDLVSRAVHFELMNGSVYLNMRHLSLPELKNNFPNITKKLNEYGFNLAEDLIPIMPVVHYFCGGVPVNLKGATKLTGLFAIGEVACTGVHGANNLASNSLLEDIVFAQSMVENLKKTTSENKKEKTVIKTNFPEISTEQEGNVGGYNRRIGRLMWKNIGLVRSKDSMEKAKKEISSMPARDYHIQNSQMVCIKIIEACLKRKESLGVHYVAEGLN